MSSDMKWNPFSKVNAAKALCLKRIVSGSSIVFIYLLVALYISLSELKFFHNYQFIFIDNY